VALIKEKNGVVVAVKKGLTTPGQFVVISINDKYLEIQDPKGKVYWVYRDKFAVSQSGSPGPATTAPASIIIKEEGFERNDNVVKMTETYRDKIVREDLSKILMQATAEPFMENGAIVGFLVSQIDEGSIFQKAGIKDGDIITRINEQELNSIANSVKLLQSLKGAKQIEVDIKRAGQIQKIRVEIN
jgi:type II secretion system protein C